MPGLLTGNQGRWSDVPLPPRDIPLGDVAKLETRMRAHQIRGQRRSNMIRDELGVSVFLYGALLGKVRQDPECQARHVRLVADLNAEYEQRRAKRDALAFGSADASPADGRRMGGAPPRSSAQP